MDLKYMGLILPLSALYQSPSYFASYMIPVFAFERTST